MVKYEQIQQILQNERLMGLLKISHESPPEGKTTTEGSVSYHGTHHMAINLWYFYLLTPVSVTTTELSVALCF